MDISQEIKKVIDSTVGVPDAVKASLHVNIMRLVERMRSSPLGKKHGVTVMTQEASLAGDDTARDRRTQPKPKTI